MLHQERGEKTHLIRLVVKRIPRWIEHRKHTAHTSFLVNVKLNSRRVTGIIWAMRKHSFETTRISNAITVQSRTNILQYFDSLSKVHRHRHCLCGVGTTILDERASQLRSCRGRQWSRHTILIYKWINSSRIDSAARGAAPKNRWPRLQRLRAPQISRGNSGMAELLIVRLLSFTD